MVVNNYTVVQAENTSALIVKVNALIAMGWVPIGGPIYEVTRNVYLQGMVTSMV